VVCRRIDIAKHLPFNARAGVLLATGIAAADAGEGSSMMSEPRISRRRLVGAGAVGALGVFLAPEAVLAGGENGEEVELLRWDLIQIVQGVVLAGGTDVAKDAASGDKISLTGSGEVRPESHKATGGGTFVHKHADGSEVGHGVYVVTAFISFANGGGSLVGTGLTDGIDVLNRTTGGVLKCRVHLTSSAGLQADGVLEVDCHLPGGRDVPEGIKLSVPQFNLNFAPDSGFTLFHVLDD
jgi:hypothetical protein